MEVAKVTRNGQVTIPADIRVRLNIKEGDKVVFMESDEGVVMLNASVVALKRLQKDMAGAAEEAGLLTEESVVALCREVRRELSGGRDANPN